ncbi:FliI/YscN family ATPase [Marivita sp. S2033]|uniref:FliI/YscN family ATPase n=1 Tax=Marivita sp. S2033 TaxID=3373187 RepID=UPI003982777C
MQNAALSQLKFRVANIAHTKTVGRVTSVDGHVLSVAGLEIDVKLGDRLRLERRDGSVLMGEVLCINRDGVTMLPDDPPDQVALSDRVVSLGPCRIAPSDEWIGRIVDPYGAPLDNRPLPQGDRLFNIHNDPPAPVTRKALGPRLNTGFHLFNTMLPIVRGQRIGIFAGSGVGKSTLLADFVRAIEADVVVLALVGERGREIRDFTKNILGDTGMARTVVVAASADSAPTARMKCPQSAMRIAEYFRDQGRHVLLLVDSVTRFAEAQREVAVSAGEFPSMRGFPPSTPSKITRLAERAGPGCEGTGDITAIFSVLVAGSDMNEPVADMLRGVLDGHIVLDRSLAERGLFPAVDLLASVSRSLPGAATEPENKLIAQARSLRSTYSEASTLISAGLYSQGADPALDQAIAFHNPFEEFQSTRTDEGARSSFDKLLLCLRRSGQPKKTLPPDSGL